MNPPVAPPRATELSEREAQWASLLIVDLMTRPKDWILRRIENISFNDDRIATRRVVVDFKIPLPREQVRSHMPADLGTIILPLALMQKRRLRVFQLADEAGQLYPTLTRETRIYIAKLALLGLAEQILSRQPSDDIRVELEAMASKKVSMAYPIHQQFVAAALSLAAGDELDDQQKERARLFTNEAFRLVAYALTWSYVLLVSVPADFGARRLMSFSYEERLIERPRRNAVVPRYAQREHQPTRWQRAKWRSRQAVRTLGRILGVAARRFDFPCSALAYCCAYHLEVEAPGATWISFSGLFVTKFWSPGRNPHSLSREDAVSLLERHRGPDDWEKGTIQRSHLYMPNTPNVAQGIAEVSLRPERRTFIRGILLTGALACALLFAALGFYERLVDVGSGTTLLLLLPTALIVYVIQPSADHALAARLLTTIRALGILFGLCLIAVAGALMLATSGKHPSQGVLEGAAYASAGALAVLIGSWFQARPRRYRSHDRGDSA